MLKLEVGGEETVQAVEKVQLVVENPPAVRVGKCMNVCLPPCKILQRPCKHARQCGMSLVWNGRE